METATVSGTTTFYTDEGTRYCESPGCERAAIFHTYPARSWSCVFHAPGTWWERLTAIPTVTQGHTSDLRIEVSGHRLWTSRMTPDDGAPYAHTVEVEVYQPIDGRWTQLGEFDGDSDTADGLFGSVNLP